MKKNITYAIVLIFLIIASGCEDLNNPGEIKIKNSLFFNLQVNSPQQHVYIYRNPDLSGRSDPFAADPYVNFFNRDAEVTLKDMLSGQSTGFRLAQDSLSGSSYYSGYAYSNPYKPYYTNPPAFKIKPLTDYYLSVNADGNSIAGKVTTPGDFEIISPRSAEEIRGSRNFMNQTITWNESKNAVGYFVSVTCPIMFYSDSTRKVLYIGSNSDIVGGTSCRLGDVLQYYYTDAIQSGAVVIRVAAYDNNYVQHYRNKKESVGLSNAYGCFSSSIMKEVRIYYEK